MSHQTGSGVLPLTDRDIVALRGPKAALHPRQAYAASVEEELDAAGTLAPTAVVLITNRECPFRCVMCDLWRNTLDETVPDGAITEQIRTALRRLPPVRQIKLYNAGSFFDPRAIPPPEDSAIASLLTGFERVIVEAHPAYLGGVYADRCVRFAERLSSSQLEVAVGLETAHEDVLARLNKRMTVDDFRRAAGFLRAHGIAVRAFVLVQPPFMPAVTAVEWACRSIDVAFEAGAEVCSVIATRGGNGAMESIGAQPPSLAALEAVVEYGVHQGRGRVFADLWDIERLFSCRCAPARAARLRLINETQRIPAAIACDCASSH